MTKSGQGVKLYINIYNYLRLWVSILRFFFNQQSSKLLCF